MLQAMSTPVEKARKALGQLFIIGFNGLELSDETSAFISQAGIGGVILFSPNYESPGQVAELVNQVQECRGDLPLWVAVDHEGGRVQRFKKGFTLLPTAQQVGQCGSPKLAFEVAELMARELKAVGVNVNFAPCADIQTNPRNPIIGSRAFGTDEESVTKMSTAIVRGHLVQGVQPCVKHFPGHGDTLVDSHLALPKVDTDLATLQDRELRPFARAFKSHCSMVMTAHIVMTKIDPGVPATLSPRILQELLRRDMRYTRLIVSDDMEMKAITEHFGAEDAPRRAIEAGCDILIYKTEAAARHAYAALDKALEDGKLSAETVLAAEARIRALKKEKLLPYHPVVVAEVSQKVGIPDHAALIQKLMEAVPQELGRTGTRDR
jgi:beta-N-acetylhexosaminidase